MSTDKIVMDELNNKSKVQDIVPADVETQDIPGDMCIEPEISEEELRDILEEAQSPVSGDVKEHDIETTLISLAKKSGISMEDVHVSFRNIMNSAIQLEDVSPVEKQRAAIKVLEMQITNYEAGQPKADSVTTSIPYGNRKIELKISYSSSNEKYINQFTVDGSDPYEFRHKEPMYSMSDARDKTLIPWLKTKVGCTKPQDVYNLRFAIRDEVAKKREVVDELAKKSTTTSTGNIIIPGYETYRIAWYDEKSRLQCDTQPMASAIIDKFHVISHKKDIWTYCDGVYIKGDDKVHEEVVKICNHIGLRRGVKDIAAEVVYRAHNQPRVSYQPFNQYIGIPCANGVVEFDAPTGMVRLIDYSPDQYFTFKIPTYYKPEVSQEHLMKVLRGWVREEDIDTLIQIPTQALLQHIYHTTFKKFYILDGPHDSGKSAFINFVIILLSSSTVDNKYGATQNSSRVAMKHIMTSQFATASMAGKMINAHSETGSYTIDMTDTLKVLVGENEQNIEPKGIDAFSAELHPTMVFGCNGVPRISKEARQDKDFWPKIEYVVFPNSYDRIANWEAENLTPDVCSAFLNLVINMMMRIIRNGFKLIKNTPGNETLAQMLTNSDPISKFVKASMVQTDRPVDHDKLAFMLSYIHYCQDEETGDMPTFTNHGFDDLTFAVEKMQTLADKGKYTELMNSIDKHLVSFSMRLLKLGYFENGKKMVDGASHYYYHGNWDFKPDSKYAIKSRC